MGLVKTKQKQQRAKAGHMYEGVAQVAVWFPTTCGEDE